MSAFGCLSMIEERARRSPPTTRDVPVYRHPGKVDINIQPQQLSAEAPEKTLNKAVIRGHAW